MDDILNDIHQNEISELQSAMDDSKDGDNDAKDGDGSDQKQTNLGFARYVDLQICACCLLMKCRMS